MEVYQKKVELKGRNAGKLRHTIMLSKSIFDMLLRTVWLMDCSILSSRAGFFLPLTQ